MLCAKCHKDNPSDASFCEGCGAKLELICPACKASVTPGARFCKKCGAAIGAAAAASAKKSDDAPIRVAETPASENLEGERKTVTALFADIKGSTELEQDLDPEEARAIVDPALRLMIDAVRRYDGYIVQSTGDGVFALFGAPVAHEDHPQRALYAALRMQEELRRYGARLQADGRAPVEIRVGVNTGEVVVRSIATGATQIEYTPIGHTTNLASRLQSIARTGSIVASEATRKLCEGYFILKPLGPAKVKGVSEPVEVYEVTGLGPLRTRLQRSAGRGYTKFVGRNREMEAIKAAAEQAKAGHGQIVAAMAEAGVGKSRLFFEFKVKHQSGWMVLEAFSVSHGKASAYLPVLDLLQCYFEISPEDDARKRRERVNGKVLTLDRSLEGTLPFLFGLLGIVEGADPLQQMDPQIRKRRTLESIKRILVRESLNQPLMVMFEDLHWIDDETQSLLNLLADTIGTVKILLLVNYRPEYSHQWNSKTYYTQLRLDPLGKEGADEMLTALVGDGDEVRPLKRLIIERTQGNPFFMEETVQVLLDEGALVRDGPAIRLTKALGALKIPPTVQAILAARIDRLPADEKDLLQTLAVVGRQFAHRLVQRIVPGSEDDLNRILGALQIAEFIYEQPAEDDVEYTFKHALTQEVAYQSLLVERRKLMHERIGNVIEELFAKRLDDHLAEIAHHHVRGGNADKATHFLMLAAQQAIWISAVDESIAYVKQGLSLLEHIADEKVRARREAALRVALGFALSRRDPASREVEAAYLRARELCAKLDDDNLLCTALAGLRLCYNFKAELDRALELGTEMLEVAERARDSSMICGAHSHLSQTLYFRGEFHPALEHIESAAPLMSQFIAEPNLTFLGDVEGRGLLIRCLLGYPEQAEPSALPALFLNQSQSALFRELFTSQIYYFLRDSVRVALHAERGIQAARDFGWHQAVGFITAMSGIYGHWVEALHGKTLQTGVAEIRRALEQVEFTPQALEFAPCQGRAGGMLPACK